MTSSLDCVTRSAPARTTSCDVRAAFALRVCCTTRRPEMKRAEAILAVITLTHGSYTGVRCTRERESIVSGQVKLLERAGTGCSDQGCAKECPCRVPGYGAKRCPAHPRH